MDQPFEKIGKAAAERFRISPRGRDPAGSSVPGASGTGEWAGRHETGTCPPVLASGREHLNDKGVTAQGVTTRITTLWME
ncbi:MAG: hypothetical protein AB1918_00260 [Pseudomonadota bacterium]